MATLVCAGCEKEFEATPSQINHLKYGEQSKVYCSSECRKKSNAHLKKPLSGPCPTCHSMFKSRGSKKKIYCSMHCYMNSPKFLEVRAEALKKSRERGYVVPDDWHPTLTTCLECNKEFKIKPGQRGKRRYCSTTCYRKYMAKRFDRWIASPQQIAMPQAFDEFLTSPVLRCLVEGCTWTGHHLSGHMNFAHGIKARQFKKLAGFNLGTGVVSLSLHENLIARDLQGVAISRSPPPPQFAPQKRTRYKSLEGREHATKTRALLTGIPSGVERVCKGCGVTFKQSTIFGKAKFHSFECRDAYYARTMKEEKYTLSCVECGSPFEGSIYQYKAALKGKPVVCSPKCKGALNGSKPKPKRRKFNLNN